MRGVELEYGEPALARVGLSPIIEDTKQGSQWRNVPDFSGTIDALYL